MTIYILYTHFVSDYYKTENSSCYYKKNDSVIRKDVHAYGLFCFINLNMYIYKPDKYFYSIFNEALKK